MIRHTILAGSMLALLSNTALAGPVFNPYASAQNTGPSSSDVPVIGGVGPTPGSPYLIPTKSCPPQTSPPAGAGKRPKCWTITSLLTTGNSINGYTMVGIPDGLGAYDNDDGSVTVLMNHELSDTNSSEDLSGDPQPPVVQGIDSPGATGHGGHDGAFVSQWVINKNTLEVLSGRDFVNTPDKFFIFDSATNSYVSGASIPGDPRLDINRLCSADLAQTSAFYNAATGNGYNGRIFLDGEEGGALGRAFGWVVGQQTAYELPKFAGSFTSSTPDTPPAFENLLANAFTGDKTVVMGNSDGGTNQVSIYIGTKTKTGTAVDEAGLNDGQMWGISVEGVSEEDRTTNVGITAGTHGLNSGTTKEISLVSPNQGTTFLRPEDGAWDPNRPNVYYFATTDRVDLSKPGENFNPDGTPGNGQVGRSRLWAITFNDVNNIATDGSDTGTVQLLLDGATNMADNMTINRNSVITIGEDTGNAAHNPKLWQYDTRNGALTEIFKHDPTKFGDLTNGVFTPPTAPFTTDKEVSGVLDVTDLFKDAAWYRSGSQVYLSDDQPHFDYPSTDPLGAELVEGGQLDLLTSVPKRKKDR